MAERITAYLAGVQERLRATELARAAESARAEEAIVRVGAERRARRFQVGLAASLLLLTIAGGLGLTYYLQQRQAGAARVGLALKEATLLRDQAVANPDDPARWPAALAGVKRADAALAEGGDPAARQQLAALGQEVQAGADAAERDKQLLVKLVDIRSAQPDEPSSAIDAAYAAAFRAAGIDLDAPEPKAAGARIAARPEPVRLAMVAALDHWTGVRKARGQGEAWRKVVEVARAADPDPDRDALRAALAVEDKAKRLEQIRPLAAKADATTWSPASLVAAGEHTGRRWRRGGGRAGAKAGLGRPPDRHLGSPHAGPPAGEVDSSAARGSDPGLRRGPRPPPRDRTRAGPRAGKDRPVRGG